MLDKDVKLDLLLVAQKLFLCRWTWQAQKGSSALVLWGWALRNQWPSIVVFLPWEMSSGSLRTSDQVWKQNKFVERRDQQNFNCINLNLTIYSFQALCLKIWLREMCLRLCSDFVCSHLVPRLLAKMMDSSCIKLIAFFWFVMWKSALGDERKKGRHVPYRQSKLTRVLQVC